DNCRILSNDLRSEWGGAIRLQGDTTHPEAHGELNLARGDFRINGKLFVLDKGKISFGGDLEANTSVNVLASQDMSGGTIAAFLRVPVTATVLCFRSNPSMSERDFLSWLMLGHGLEEASRFEARELNQMALHVASGKKEKPGFLQRLRRIGIDRIEVDNV